MPKVKLPRKSTNIDMTAMCDVAFLLLSFFMLATQFKPDEPVQVTTPSSISDIPLPDTSIMLITIDPQGRTFFAIDNKYKRKELIENMNEYKNLNLSEQEMASFAIGSSVGVPLRQLKSYLASTPEQQSQFDATSAGIPLDTAITEANELSHWIRSARATNKWLRICIKADSKTSYPEIQKVVKTLGGLDIFKFNLITSMEGVPQGTAAFAEATKKQKEGKH